MWHRQTNSCQSKNTLHASPSARRSLTEDLARAHRDEVWLANARSLVGFGRQSGGNALTRDEWAYVAARKGSLLLVRSGLWRGTSTCAHALAKVARSQAQCCGSYRHLLQREDSGGKEAHCAVDISEHRC
jgi:hypothetical protein